MTNLVIVAGGLGSRLAPLTNQIPKFLVNIGKNTGYVEMIRYWSKIIDLTLESPTLTVIVNQEYKALVEAYHELYFKEIPLIVKTVAEANGSADAILSTCSHLNGEPVMFTWCDVLPADPIGASFGELTEAHGTANVIFTNYKNSNRYGLKALGVGSVNKTPYLDSTERGGCFGLYYINRYHSDAQYKIGQDFIEIIDQYGAIHEQEIENIIDFGDMPKLQRTRSKADEAREFNSVEIVGDFVLKQATNEQGQKIMEKEILWYEALGMFKHSAPVPKAWIANDRSGMFLEKIHGVPIWKALGNLSEADRRHVLQQLIVGEQKLYDLRSLTVPRDTVVRDVGIESGEKLLQRYSEIENVIKAFGEVRTVNGYQLKESDPRKTIQRLTGALKKYYYDLGPVQKYGFIHGDLQMSNSMVNLDTMKVSIIDPRGYFGQTVGHGLQDYDIGKLLYALSGYDLFNMSKWFGIKDLKNGALKFEIPKPSHIGIQDIVSEHFKPVHYYWLAVCWIGLAQYIKNDPVKSLCAHYHGLELAEQALVTPL